MFMIKCLVYKSHMKFITRFLRIFEISYRIFLESARDLNITGNPSLYRYTGWAGSDSVTNKQYIFLYYEINYNMVNFNQYIPIFFIWNFYRVFEIDEKIMTL